MLGDLNKYVIPFSLPPLTYRGQEAPKWFGGVSFHVFTGPTSEKFLYYFSLDTVQLRYVLNTNATDFPIPYLSREYEIVEENLTDANFAPYSTCK